MNIKHLLIIVFLALLPLKTFATHIVGGEIFYDWLSGNTYRITLKLYRDCFNGIAPYDNPGTIFIFDNSGNFVDSVEIPFPGSVVLPVTISNPCFIPPTNICVEEAIYQTNIVLPPIAGGYNIMYQRCCRNGSILNINSPGSVGSTYMAHIPGPATGVNNSSPHYINFPPIFLCLGVPLNFNHAATDTDGDSLYYELCDPFTGLDPSCPFLGPQAALTGCPAIGSPPPYSAVPWLSPYSGTYPLSSSPALTIHPQTGHMSGTPNMLGQFVVAVCVSEYRNGVLLDVNKRDFQFNVVDCPGLPVAVVIQQSQFCFGYTVNFTQSSVNASSYHWDFGDPATPLDTSAIQSPSWTYADSGIYTVKLIINPGTLCADSQSSTFRVYPVLAPAFTPPPRQCVNNNSFNFIGGGSYMGNGAFSWNFGTQASPSSGNQLNQANVVFDSSGVFPVTFTVSENGCSKSVTDSVHVDPKPLAYFGLSTETGCALHPVHFIDSSQTPPLTYLWDFGNGTTSTLQNPVTTYTAPGSYQVSLIITSLGGCKDTFILSNPVVVNASPIAGFSLTPTSTTIAHPEIYMTDQSQFATVCNVFWGDGTQSNNCDSMHRYTLAGTYTIMQVVKNASGCYDTAYSDIIINSEFFFWIPNAFTPNNNNLNELFKPKAIGVHDYSFLIFDRWGEKLFETSDSEAGWNGYYKNELCSNDVYTYKIAFRDNVQNSFHQYIGIVTLVR